MNELVKECNPVLQKIINGQATRQDVKKIADLVAFDLEVGTITDVLQKYVVAKNIITLFKGIADKLQTKATEIATQTDKDELADICGARVTIKKVDPEYDFDEPRFHELKNKLEKAKMLLEETKYDVADLQDELKLLTKTLLKEGKEGRIIEPAKESITITLK